MSSKECFAVFVVVSFFVSAELAKADQTSGKVPSSGPSYTIDSPQGQALHQQMISFSSMQAMHPGSERSNTSENATGEKRFRRISASVVD